MRIVLLICGLLFLTACGEIIGVDPMGLAQPIITIDDGLNGNDYDEYDIEALPIETPSETAEIVPQNEALRLSMRPPLTLNPLLNEDITVARILRLIYEPLNILDENFRPTSHLASVEFASDFSSANLTIRNDAIWQDGLPVTSDDVIFSIQTLQNAPATAIYRDNVTNIQSYTRISARVLQLSFVNPSVTVGYALNFPIIPSHHTDFSQPMGNGLFMYDSFLPMRSFNLRRSPTSFRSRPQIENIQVFFAPDAQTEFYALDHGRIDALHMSLPDWSRHHGVRPLNYEIFPAMDFEFIGFNFDREMFRELHTRQGIAHAFNASEAISAIYLAHAVRATSPIHPYYWAAADNAAFYHAFDQERATSLLGLIRDLPPEPLQILVNEENPQRMSIASRLAESLTAVGLNTEIAPVSETDYFARLGDSDFDLFIGGITLPFTPDKQIFFNQSELFMQDSWLDAAFQSMMVASTETAYLQAVENFQQTFASRLPVISLAFRHSAMLTNTRVTQGAHPAPDNALAGINEWTVEIALDTGA